MKKGFLLFFVLIGVVNLAKAQYDPKALEILDAMSAKYQSISAYEVEISHHMVNEEAGIDENMQYEATIKGDKFRANLLGQEIINNGETIWRYMEQDEMVEVYNNDPESNQMMTPSSIYNAYKDGYKYMLVESIQEEGHTYHLVDLLPEDIKNKEFFRIRIKIDAKDKLMKGWKMFEKSGTIHEFTINKFNSSVNIPDTYFSFEPSKHPGVEVVDMR
jgi:outer membrane lipoprotein carrier protein